MDSKCRFPSCEWSGDVNNLFEHCETYHSRFIKEIDDKNKITFTFDDIFTEVFLLNGSGGLYWFLLDPIEHENCLKRGIFAIGESEICEFTLKIGSINTDFRYDVVKKFVQPENSNQFELVWPYDFLESMDDLFKSKKMVIYFGECNLDEEEVYTGTYEDVDWNDPEEEHYNNMCLQKFTCPVCLEYIRSNAKFCENRHFICSGCLDEMIKRKKAICPQCRGDYSYDCVDEDIEEILRCIRFPIEN